MTPSGEPTCWTEEGTGWILRDSPKYIQPCQIQPRQPMAIDASTDERRTNVWRWRFLVTVPGVFTLCPQRPSGTYSAGASSREKPLTTPSTWPRGRQRLGRESLGDILHAKKPPPPPESQPSPSHA